MASNTTAAAWQQPTLALPLPFLFVAAPILSPTPCLFHFLFVFFLQHTTLSHTHLSPLFPTFETSQAFLPFPFSRLLDSTPLSLTHACNYPFVSSMFHQLLTCTLSIFLTFLSMLHVKTKLFTF